MQAIGDLFQVFGPPRRAVTELAEAVGEKRDTVYRWLRSGRIPETSWPAVITATQRHGVRISADTLLKINKPAGKRGRPPKKAKKMAARKGRR
jgi:hypothetical protein